MEFFSLKWGHLNLLTLTWQVVACVLLCMLDNLSTTKIQPSPLKIKTLYFEVGASFELTCGPSVYASLDASTTKPRAHLQTHLLIWMF